MLYINSGKFDTNHTGNRRQQNSSRITLQQEFYSQKQSASHIIKRWSAAESFTMFENHDYPLLCPKFFAFFWSQNWRSFYPYYKWSFAPIFCLFWSQNWRNFYPYYKYNIAQFFAFFWSQNWRTFYPLLHMKSCPISCLFWSHKWRTLNSWLPCILPKFYAFFWSQKWRTF